MIDTIPVLRDELSLAGNWSFAPDGEASVSATVPEYWEISPGLKIKQALYQRQVTIPADWTGMRLKVEFEAVNHIAEVRINGQVVGTHVGGWLPFSVDVPSSIVAGETFDLSVDVKAGCFAPISDERGLPVWPVGWFGHEPQWGNGIIYDVHLRAYGQVQILDTFIQTSFRQKTLTAQYTLHNADSAAQKFILHAQAMRAGTNYVECELISKTITLSAGETQTIQLSEPWDKPQLWSPQSPSLYHLCTQLIQRGNVIDQETRHFGFRELWVEGSQFYFNGTRFNLWGTSTTAFGKRFDSERTEFATRDKWPQTVDNMLGLNIRVLRFHQSPAPKYALDVADQRGLIVIAESAIYARKYMHEVDKARYLSNAQIWLGQWVRSQRNHPSVLLWSAENEMGDWLSWHFSRDELKSLGDSIRQHDTTRVVIYDGDLDVGDATVNWHYPEGYQKEPTPGSVNGMAAKCKLADKPVGVGEFLIHYTNTERMKWWQATFVRGLRCMDFTDIRPYTLTWTWADPTTPQAQNVRNSLAPVALFDKAYDDLGIDPLANAAYPTLEAGGMERRTLVLFNDELQETSVDITVEIKAGDAVLAAGQQRLQVGLGEHVEIPCTFQVPLVGGEQIDLVLSTHKAGVQKFCEAKRFTVVGQAAKAAAAPAVIELG